MIKTLIAAVVSAIFGVVLTTLKKDRVILELQQEVKNLNSYERFSETFMSGYKEGKESGWHAGYEDAIRRKTSHLN